MVYFRFLEFLFRRSLSNYDVFDFSCSIYMDKLFEQEKYSENRHELIDTVNMTRVNMNYDTVSKNWPVHCGF